MKRKAKASLTVEIAMLFPIVFLLLLAVMQCALFLVYETYVKALCDQGVILCQSWYCLLYTSREGGNRLSAAGDETPHFDYGSDGGKSRCV